MSDSVTVTTAEEPELTKDTNAEFSVSDTVNLDPQTVEYNTTPEVAEYQRTVEIKHSLEEYSELLRQAGGMLSAQTAAVMNVQLASVDRLIGQPAMGMEHFDTSPLQALRPGNVSVESMNARLDRVCHFLNTHPATSRHHARHTVSLEEVKEEMKKNGNIFARIWQWLMSLIERAKEWLGEKWSNLEASLDDVKDSIKFLIQNVEIREFITDEAWANGEYIARTTDREEAILDWLERKYLPWNTRTQQEAVKFLEGFHQGEVDANAWDIEEEIDKWLDNHHGPEVPDVVFGGSMSLEYSWKSKIDLGHNTGSSVELSHMPETAMSGAEATALVTKIRALVNRAKKILGDDPYARWTPPEVKVNASGRLVSDLFDAISPVRVYQGIWPALYKSLHAKVIALNQEAIQSQRAAVNGSVDEWNARIREKRANSAEREGLEMFALPFTFSLEDNESSGGSKIMAFLEKLWGWIKAAYEKLDYAINNRTKIINDMINALKNLSKDKPKNPELTITDNLGYFIANGQSTAQSYEMENKLYNWAKNVYVPHVVKKIATLEKMARDYDYATGSSKDFRAQMQAIDEGDQIDIPDFGLPAGRELAISGKGELVVTPATDKGDDITITTRGVGEIKTFALESTRLLQEFKDDQSIYETLKTAVSTIKNMEHHNSRDAASSDLKKECLFDLAMYVSPWVSSVTTNFIGFLTGSVLNKVDVMKKEFDQYDPHRRGDLPR